MDGHVRNVRLMNAVGCGTPETSSALARLLSKGGEPLWFNYDSRKSTDSAYKGECKVFVDPRVYFDNLP